MRNTHFFSKDKYIESNTSFTTIDKSLKNQLNSKGSNLPSAHLVRVLKTFFS